MFSRLLQSIIKGYAAYVIARDLDKSFSFGCVDGCSLRCPLLRSVTLSDGEYYEMVKSNFERADRATVVRTTTNYTTSLVALLSAFRDLLFN